MAADSNVSLVKWFIGISWGQVNGYGDTTMASVHRCSHGSPFMSTQVVCHVGHSLEMPSDGPFSPMLECIHAEDVESRPTRLIAGQAGVAGMVAGIALSGRS